MIDKMIYFSQDFISHIITIINSTGYFEIAVLIITVSIAMFTLGLFRVKL